jgi:CheY-like chemotaxis protein
MDGYEIARRLRQEGLAILLVAVTGFGTAEDRRRAEEAGFDTHLTKPVSPDALRRVLRGGDAKP